MIQPEGLTEQLLFNTVRIVGKSKGNEIGTGTGFFFRFELDDGKSLPVIITNKHVVGEAEVSAFRVHLGELHGDKLIPSGKFAGLDIVNAGNWFPHPNDKIDLCAMLANPLESQAATDGQNIFSIYLSDNDVPTDSELTDLDAVEDVSMVGYPNALWDEVNNFPLFRRGVTATHPAVDFNGTSTTIIDAACFPGSSGSPVLLINKGMSVSKSGTTNIGVQSVKLLVVLSAGPVITAKGEIKIQSIPTVTGPYAEMKMMMHLGFVIKSRELLSLGESLIEELKTRGAI